MIAYNLKIDILVKVHLDLLSCCKKYSRWKGGAGVKLKGSDHAPVCVSLDDIPIISQHNTALLSTRYCPQVEGCQQTLGAISFLFIFL